MLVSVIFSSIASVFILCCKAASLLKANEIAIFHAITEGRIQDLEEMLKDYDGDINEKTFTVADGDSEFMVSALELAAASHNPEIMSLIIENKKSIIDIEVFEIVFKSRCFECFDILLDHSKDLFSWRFNRTLFEKLSEYSAVNDDFFVFTAKLSKRLGLCDQLGLIENSFDNCSDHERIMLTADAVLLDVSYKESVNEYMKKDERTAVISFARAMIFKKDFDDLLPWIDSLYHEYPGNKNGTLLIENYKNYVKLCDNRVEDYPQPEEIGLRDDSQVFLNISEAIRNNTKVNGMRVLLKILIKNSKGVWSSLEKYTLVLEELNRTLDFAIENNLIQSTELLLETGFNFNPSFIFKLIRENSVKLLELLLRHGADPNYKNDGQGDSDAPLLEAVNKGSAENIELLLKYGADSTVSDINGNTPLIIAGLKNRTLKVFELLLKHGADPNAANTSSTTALMYAVRKSSVKTVSFLLNNGANPNIYTVNGETPLGRAIVNDSEEIVELLLRYGADPNFGTDNHRTPLERAVIENSSAIVELLLHHGANPNVVFKNRKTPLEGAVTNGSYDIVALLLDHGANPNLRKTNWDNADDHKDNQRDNDTPLMEAVNAYSFKCVELLLNHEADPNIIDIEGNTPLNKAASSARGDKIVRLLLKHGAEPNIANNHGITPLFNAMIALFRTQNIYQFHESSLYLGSAKIVEVLLKHGADPNIANSNGETPLEIALEKNSADIVEILLHHGANPNFAFTNGKTPLELAIEGRKYDIESLLRAHSANI